MKTWIKALVILFGLIFIYQMVGAFFFIIGIVFYGDVDSVPGNYTMMALILTQLSMLGFVYLIFKTPNFKIYIRMKRPNRKMLLWSLIGGMAILPISTLMISGMALIIPDVVARYIDLMETSLGDANLVIVLISVAILAPVVEEVMLRGVLFRQLETATKNRAVIVVLSGVIFGIFHLNIVQGVFTTFAGILFALAFLWTKNLWVPIMLHLGNNVFAVLIGELPETLLESTWFNTLFVALIVFVPISFYMLYQERYQESLLEVKTFF